MDEADINRQKVMQLATSADGQPWICSVYFVLSGGKFYWLSFPDRRHSQELAKNERAALTVAIKQSVPVKGLQVEGMVRVVRELPEVEAVLATYVEKYGQGGQFVTRFKAGENKHNLYCLTPRRMMLFDETIPSDQPYQKITFDASKLSHRAISRVGIRKKGIL